MEVTTASGIGLNITASTTTAAAAATTTTTIGNYSLVGAAISQAISTVTSRLEQPSTTQTTGSLVTSQTISSSIGSSSGSSLAYTTRATEATTTSSWVKNLTRLGEALPKPDTGSSSTTGASISSTVKLVTTSTEEPFDEFGPPEGVEYIFVPLGVMIFVIVLSAVVIIISRKRKLERLRHRLMPLYNFDPGEEGEDDWETELLDEGFSSRQRRQGYQSMDSEDNTELFSPAHMQTLG